MELEFQLNVNPVLVSVRDFEIGDIPYVLDYWFHSPPGFIESIGADPEKLPGELEMEEHLTKRIQHNQKLSESKLNALTILYDGVPIGFHTLVPLVEGVEGIFHAHIWNSAMRGKGIGVYSYVRALRTFMERFRLQKVIFKTPIQNTGAIRVKEKLGIRCIGEESIGFDIIREGTLGKVYELTRDELFTKLKTF
jgi:RimJ/RimL family protein N-acetyltransferase